MHERRRLAGEVFAAAGDDRALQRACAAGRLHRVRPGVYVEIDVWASLDARWRHLITVTALMHATRGRLAVSHESAAALWDFPDLDGWPDAVHVVDADRTTHKRTPGLVRHVGSIGDDATLRWGVTTTGALRTAVDIALGGGFWRGLIAFDHGLRRGLFRREHLEAELIRRGRVRGIRDAREACDLATADSESVGESLSKGMIHRLGFPRPVQQKAFPNPRGRDFHVDFWWSEIGLIGEFDGEEKYRSEAMRSGRSLDDVLLDEKRRTDDLLARPEVANLVRWRYADARNARILLAILTAAGMRADHETPLNRRFPH